MLLLVAFLKVKVRILKEKPLMDLASQPFRSLYGRLPSLRHAHVALLYQRCELALFLRGKPEVKRDVFHAAGQIVLVLHISSLSVQNALHVLEISTNPPPPPPLGMRASGGGIFKNHGTHGTAPHFAALCCAVSLSHVFA
jgi:hypothetical protein